MCFPHCLLGQLRSYCKVGIWSCWIWTAWWLSGGECHQLKIWHWCLCLIRGYQWCVEELRQSLDQHSNGEESSSCEACFWRSKSVKEFSATFEEFWTLWEFLSRFKVIEQSSFSHLRSFWRNPFRIYMVLWVESIQVESNVKISLNSF